MNSLGTLITLSILSLAAAGAPAASAVPSVFAVRLVRGPAWPAGAKVVPDLPGVGAHAEAMRRLHARGLLLAGGPEDDLEAALCLVVATSRSEAEALFADDPLVASGMLRAEARGWNPALSQLDFGAVLANLATPWEGESQEGPVRVRWRRSRDLRAELEVVVTASAQEVWQRWTTVPGIRTFLAPDAAVDVRPGGRYEAYWLLDAPAGLRGSEGTFVLSLDAPRRLSLAWNAPANLPEVRASHFRMDVQIDELAARETRVRLVLDGFKDGDQWRRAFDYFLRADARVLERLHRSFAVGPVDWERELPRQEHQG